jgi:hypothetical protein
MNAVENPSRVISAIKNAQNIATRLLRSTAFTLDTTAVTISTSRSAIMGKLKTAVEKVSAAKMVPNADVQPALIGPVLKLV